MSSQIEDSEPQSTPATRFNNLSTDAELVWAAATYQGAFTLLYQRYVSRVYRYLLIQLSNTQDAEDVTAQTFLEALQSLHRFGGQSTFATWLLSIARHRLVDHVRARRAHTSLSLAGADDHIDHSISIESIAEIRLCFSQVVRALRAIHHDRAEVIYLRAFYDLDYAEIAVVMKRSESACKMLLSRALTELREHLTNEDRSKNDDRPRR